MGKPVKLTKRETRLLDAMKSGLTLCCEFVNDTRVKDGRRWFLEPTGKVVDYEVAERLLARDGLVKPRKDGLFAEACSQSFEAAP